MCSGCARAKAARLPGGSPQNPILYGEPDGRPAQPVTIIATGLPVFAAGDGVEDAAASGELKIGIVEPAPAPAPRRRKVSATPEWYVQTGHNKWVGFKTRAAAERYANTTGGELAHRDDVVNGRVGE